MIHPWELGLDFVITFNGEHIFASLPVDHLRRDKHIWMIMKWHKCIFAQNKYADLKCVIVTLENIKKMHLLALISMNLAFEQLR